jgi:hypothetical protein
VDRKFAYKRKDGTFSRSVSLQRLMSRAALQVQRGTGRFTLTQDGEPIRTNLTRAGALGALRRRLAQGDVGPTYRLRNGAGDVVFVAREVAALKIIDTSGNKAADLYWSTIVAKFPQYNPRFAGAYVCKTVAGTSTMSQHSYGNAVDIFFDTFAHQEAVADWVVAHADKLNVAHAISGDRIWTRGAGWHAYTGEYHSHLHVDFEPQFSGPCGVREP